MSNLNTQASDRDNLSQHDQLKAQAINMISQGTAWNGTFTSLHGNVNVESQAILDAEKIVFINAMKIALGI